MLSPLFLRSFLACLYVAVAGACPAVSLPAAGGQSLPSRTAATPNGPELPDRPNLVLFIADDLGWSDLSWHQGEPRTPNLAALAEQGLVLDRFYAQPLCTPSRAALFTGRTPVRFGLQDRPIRPWDRFGLPTSEILLPELLREAGYETALVGKWHLGHGGRRQHPNARGFDHFYGFLTGAVDYWTHRRGSSPDWQRDGVPIEEEGYSTDLLGAEAVRRIRERDPKRPLFLCVAFNAPHTPLQAPPALEAHYPREPKARRRTYCAMVESMDLAIGEVLGALDEQGIADQTLVVFVDDNGGARREGARNGDLRGGKGTAFEGGVRVPAAMRWPGHLPAGAHSGQVLSMQDLFPTLLAAAGVALPHDRTLDGIDLLSALEKGELRSHPPLYFGSRDSRFFFRALLDGDWKYVWRQTGGKGPGQEMLFRVDRDPSEKEDLAAEYPEKLRELARLCEAWSGLDPYPGDPIARTQPPPGWQEPADWTLAAQGTAPEDARPPRRPPNLVLLLADDLGWNDLHLHGGEMSTPHLDQLAAEGLEFTDFHAYPLCTPTRAALLTGQDPMSMGLAYSPLRPWDAHGLPARVPTLAERLRAVGYETACIGKWHLGHARAEMRPMARGFEHFYGFLNGTVDPYTHRSRDGALDWQSDGHSSSEDGFATRLLAREALAWLRERDLAQPFFLYLPFRAPHVPLNAPPDTLAHYAGTKDRERATYCAMVEEMDTAIGQVFEVLQKRGLARNTLVLFLSDNGAGKGEGGSNAPFRGAKGSTFEGGIRVPALLRWPGRVTPGTRDQGLRSVLDVAPTLLAAAGLPIPADMEGRSLLAPTPPERRLYFAARHLDTLSYAVLAGHWKLLRRVNVDGSHFRERLFDLERDPTESTDLSAAHPDRVKELSTALDSWIASGPPPTTVAPSDTPPPGWRAPRDWAEDAPR